MQRYTTTTNDSEALIYEGSRRRKGRDSQDSSLNPNAASEVSRTSNTGRNQWQPLAPKVRRTDREHMYNVQVLVLYYDTHSNLLSSKLQ
jgi:hypothetical protein